MPEEDIRAYPPGVALRSCAYTAKKGEVVVAVVPEARNLLAWLGV
jgi:hypothetical protein